MRKFKFGDKVRIRKDLKPYEIYGGIDVVAEMAEQGGEVHIILGCDSDTSGTEYYSISDSPYMWTDAMLEPVEEAKTEFDNVKDAVAAMNQKVKQMSEPVKVEIFRGNKGTTVCLMKDAQGNVVRKGLARCCEGDTYSLEVGAYIALSRALSLKPAKEVMNESLRLSIKAASSLLSEALELSL